MVEPLELINREEWPTLVSLFPGPEGITARVTIKTQIRGIKKNPNLSADFYAPHGDPHDGLVFICKATDFMSEISVFCLKEDKSVLFDALVNTKIIDRSNPYLFCSVMPSVTQLCLDVLEKLGSKDYSQDKTVIAYAPLEKARNFIIPDCPDVRIETLDPKYANEIDEVWPHRHPHSLEYFQNKLAAGSGIGLINNENDELAGWIFTSNRGDLHALQIKDKYKRKGYGQLLVKLLGKKITEDDIEVFGCVVITNTVSKAMFTKCGFDFSYITSWIFVR